MHQYDAAFLIIADGARPDVLADLLAEGALPHMETHIVRRGTFVPAVSCFTSTSGPGYVPFLTGCFPGTANMPGVRWLDKRHYRDGAQDGDPGWRDYCGPGLTRFDDDMPAELRTAFDYAGDALNVFGIVKRGLQIGADLEPALKARLWRECHDHGDWTAADEAVIRLLVHAGEAAPRFTYAIMPGIDGTSHGCGPTDERVLAAYRRVDHAVGELVATLQARGVYERAVIAIGSDHGHALVHHHFDVGAWMDEQRGVPTRYGDHAPARAEAAVCVSGNSMAAVYLRTPAAGEAADSWGEPACRSRVEECFPGLVRELLEQPGVDVVLARDADGGVVAQRRAGYARLADGRVAFERLLPPATYPDAFAQTEQLFRSERAGDLVLSASAGWDLRERFEHPEHRSGHGSLLAAHMLTPLLVSHPLEPGDAPVRTADLLPTLLELLALPFEAAELDGRSLLAPAGH